MKYSFLPKRTSAGNLVMVIDTDKEGTDQVLANTYLKSLTPSSETVEEFLGEMRFGEVGITVRDKDRTFRDGILSGITRASLLLHIDNDPLFYGDIDIDTKHVERSENTLSVTGFSIFMRLKDVTVEQLYEHLRATGAFATTNVNTTFGVTQFNLCTLRKIFEAMAYLSGQSSVSFTTDWRFAAHPFAARTGFENLYVTDFFFSTDTSSYPWSWMQFSSCSELLASLQRMFMCYSRYDYDVPTGNIAMSTLQRFMPSQTLITPTGGMKNAVDDQRTTSGVSAKVTFPSRERHFLTNFNDGTFQGWETLNASNGFVELVSPGFSSLYALRLRPGGASPAELVVRYPLPEKRSGRVTLRAWLKGGFFPGSGDAKVCFMDGTTVVAEFPITYSLVWAVQGFDEHSISIDSVEIRFKQVTHSLFEELNIDDVDLTISGESTVVNAEYGVQGKNSFDFELPFVFDFSDEVDITKEDQKRFLYGVYGGAYYGVYSVSDEAGRMWDQLSRLAAAKYWQLFGGLRALCTKTHRGLFASDGSSSITKMRALSRVEMDSDMYGEVIDVRKDVTTNEMEFTAIQYQPRTDV